MCIRDSKRLDLFAATPPLECLKMLLSFAVTEKIGYQPGHKESGMKLDFIDVKKAYYSANARRELYIELPEGDREPGMVGKCNKAVPGTRDAAQCWEHEYSTFLTGQEDAGGCGFVRGIASTCVFYHKARKLRVVVHGDDLTVLGLEHQLDWFRKVIGARYTVKFRGRIGPGKNDMKQIRILNRIVEWTERGIA